MVQIRQAQEQDIPTLCQLIMTVQELHRQEMPHRYRAITPDDPALVQLFANKLGDEQETIFIAEINDEAIGYLSLQIRDIPDHPLVFGYRGGHIDQMSVNEAYQGQGVGKALMNHAIEFAKSQNVGRMTLGVVAFNQRAIRFYESFGFEFGSHRMALNIT
ncbi:MAG: GNAT family N-acetyltransferase [Chloroflexota bacterium]